jgi:filamentous hemagglutinin
VIQVGSGSQTVLPNDLLTAAEFVAVRQVVKTGSQFIQLDSMGAAVGGSFRITPGLLQHAENLVVPTGVTALVDAAKSANLALAGNLTNAGQILTYSSNHAVDSIAISTQNIFNQPGALISSNGLLATAFGANSVVSQLSMSLNAAQNIVNAGQIVSSGSLTMTAGGSIVNALPASIAGPNPVLQAMQNVNLTANTLVNSGTVTSTLNNINIASRLLSNLNVINSGGVMSALSGAINFRDPTFSALANLSVNGGDLIAQELNLHSGIGVVELNVNDLIGSININACETHVNAATENLVLGNIELSGDPSFINTAGNVTIGSSMIFAGQSLSVLASGDVTTTASNLTIDTSSSSASGGNILIAAGANLSSDGTTLTVSQSGLSTGGSATGGKIDFAASPLLTLTSRGLAAGTSNGGNITLVAYAGSGVNAGTISLPTGNALTIRSGGSNTGSNGNVTIIAGANRGSGNSISLGSINSSGGTNGTGQITLSTSSPTISGGNILVNIASGAASGGTFTPGVVQAASVVANNLTTTGSNITVSAGSNATLGALTLLGDRTPGLANPTIQVDVNQVTDTATTFVVGGPSLCTNCAPSGMSASASSGGVNGNAGTISIRNFGTGGIKVTNPALLTVPVLTLNGAGGTIILDAAAGATAGAVDLAGGIYSADAVGTGTGGKIDVRGSTITNTSNTTAWTFSAKGGNNGGGGGQVALATKDSTSGIAFGTAVKQITALNVQSGTGGGDGGTVTLSAGQELLVATSRINSRPQGVNGNGPTFNLRAGTAGSGLLQISGALNANGAGSGAGGTVNIEYNDAANPFIVGSTVTGSGISGNITADAPGSGSGGAISISNSAAAPLAVALTGLLSASSASGPKGTLTFSHSSNDVNVSGAGSLSGLVNASARSVTVSTAVGDLTFGQVSSFNGLISLAANAGNLSLTSNLTATGDSLSLTSGSTGNVTTASGTNVSGSSVNINSGAININGQVTANAGNVSLQSNETDNTLNVLIAPASNVSALGVDSRIAFNQSASGSISVSGGALVATDSLEFNGGSNTVNVSVNSLSGTVNANGSDIDLAAFTGSLTAGTIASSNGDVVLTATNGDLFLTGDVTAAGGDLNLTAGPAGSLTQSASTSATGDAVSITSGSVDLQGTLGATAGNVSVQSNAADASLNIIMGSAATLSALGLGASISLNQTAGGAVAVNGGTLSASNSIQVNGGPDTVALAVLATAGTVSATGVSVSIIVGSGDLSTGAVSSAAGNVAIIASAGSIFLNDNVTASGGDLTLVTSATGALNQTSGKFASGSSASISSALLNINGTITAEAGEHSVQSNAIDGQLSILLGSGASLKANGAAANLTFNATTTGVISVTGPDGSLTASNEVRFNAGSGAVDVSTGTISGQVSSNGSKVTLATASGGITVANTTASNGSIVIRTTGSALTPLRIADNAVLSATEGDIELVDSNSTSGAIVFGQGANVSATTTGTTLGRVNVAIGSVPASPVAGTAPTNVQLTLSNGGTVYWGGGLIASLPSNQVTSNGGRVIFSNGESSAGTITLSGNVDITSTAVNNTPPPLTLIASLDFTDPNVVANILDLQSQGKIGGTLQVRHGIAVGGDAIIGSALLAPTLTAKNLPANVTLTMQDFDATKPINISLTNQSSTRQVRINGTEQFVGPSAQSNVFITITSNQSEPVLVIGKTGSITSDGGLSIAASGDIRISGPISASALSISTTARNGDILIDADVTTTGMLSLSANGSGDIRWLGGMLSAQTIALSSQTGNIGAAHRYLQFSAQNLSANTGGGNVYIKGLVDFSLLASSAEQHFMLKAIGNISLPNSLSAKIVEITADSAAGEINVGGNISASSRASLITTGAGSIEYTAGTITSDEVLLQSERGYIGTSAAPIRVAASELTALAGGGVFLSSIGDIELGNSKAGGEFKLSSTGGITARDILTLHGSITLIAGAGTLKIQNGSLLKANEGNILLQNTNTLNGEIEVGKNAVVWAYTDCNPNLGNVTLAIGSVPTSPVAGTKPSSVTVVSQAGGKVYFGTNGITAGKNVLLLALARDIVFSTGTRSSSAIKLGNGVTIIADPPIASEPIATSTIMKLPVTQVQGSAQITIPMLPTGTTSIVNARDILAPIPRSSNQPLSASSLEFSESLDTTGATGVAPESPSSASDLQQIAYVQPATPSQSLMMHRTGALTERTLGRNQVEPGLVEESPGTFRLAEEEALVSAERSAVLKLGNCEVAIAAGTFVLLSHEKGLVRIRNIYERSANSVKVNIHNGHTISTSVGEELIVGESADSVRTALNEDGIGRRRTKISTLAGGKTICRSEASLVTVLQRNELLRNLITSSRNQDKAVANKLVKMAACLMISTQSHGIYSSSK